MSDEIVEALIDQLQELVPDSSDLVEGESCSACGLAVRVIRGGVGFCVSCDMPRTWPAQVKMQIQNVLSEAREHGEFLSTQQQQKPLSLGEQVSAVRALVPEGCSVWMVREHLACSCECQVRLLVQGKVFCPGCHLPATWTEEKRERIRAVVA